MSLLEKVKKLVESQPLAVLSTSRENYPHTTLVAQRTNIQERKTIFVTTTSSRKAENIKENPQVSLFIDNRQNTYKDFRDTIGVTIKGKATQTPEYTDYFLEKHPNLIDFVHSPSTGIFCIEIERIEVVTEFQKVYELNLNE